MNKNDVIDDIKKYLIKKNFNFEIRIASEDTILFTYKYLNYNFFVYLNLLERDKDILITYFSNNEVLNIKRLRNSSNVKNYYKNVYNNLNYIKSELSLYANKKKLELDNKNKYCLELESYYKKFHNNISVIVDENKYDEIVDITIIGYDKHKTTYYNIIYKNNKYFLDSKRETFLIKQ